MDTKDKEANEKKAYVTEEKIQQTTENHYKEFINDIQNCLNSKINKEHNARISEDNFVNVFLPFFAGEENIYDVSLGNWVSVASMSGHLSAGQFREVDVVDNEGNILFTVPPILDRDAIKPAKLDDRATLPILMEQANLLGAIKPSLKINMQNKIFNSLLDKMDNGNERARSYLVRWNDIFTRYGRESIFKVEKNINSQSSDIGDDTTYEIEEL